MTTTTAAATTSSTQRQWAFLGEGALPANPIARRHEKRGRRWLVVSYVFCPCHIPLILALVGAAFGGSTIGAALSGNALGVGIALTAIYAVVLWRGFRQIRRAKQIEAAGATLTCTPRGCDITTPISPFMADVADVSSGTAAMPAGDSIHPELISPAPTTRGTPDDTHPPSRTRRRNLPAPGTGPGTTRPGDRRYDLGDVAASDRR